MYNLETIFPTPVMRQPVNALCIRRLQHEIQQAKVEEESGIPTADPYPLLPFVLTMLHPGDLWPIQVGELWGFVLTPWGLYHKQKMLDPTL